MAGFFMRGRMGGMPARFGFSLRNSFLLLTRLALLLGSYAVTTHRNSIARPKYRGAAPLATGTLQHVTVWKKPVQRPGETGNNEGFTPAAGSYIEIYDQFILI